MNSILNLLRSPDTKTPLHKEGDDLVSEDGTHFPVDQFPRLLTPTKDEEEEKVREKMQKFYETVTFPGYDGIDSPSVLMDKAGKSGFGKWVDQAISPFATVLEVGCGTGQMTNFIGLASTRNVIGVDQSIASLKLGQDFRDRFDLKNVHFVQGNIFAMPIAEQSIDVLLCSGVLHHTPDPYGGYKELLKLVKPKGKIIIGLYNSYARIPLGMRKMLFRCSGKTFRWLDAHMRRKDVDKSKKEIWFADQYRNPHESWHSVDEVLKWFEETNVKFLSGVPQIAGSIEGETDGMKLFEQHPVGSKPQHILNQLKWMFTIGREGGLFVMVGEKN